MNPKKYEEARKEPGYRSAFVTEIFDNWPFDEEYRGYVSKIQCNPRNLFSSDGREGIMGIQPSPLTLFGVKKQKSKIITTPGAFRYFDIWPDFLNCLKHELIHAKKAYEYPTNFFERFLMFGTPIRKYPGLIEEELKAHEYQYSNLSLDNTSDHVHRVGTQIMDLRMMLEKIKS